MAARGLSISIVLLLTAAVSATAHAQAPNAAPGLEPAALANATYRTSAAGTVQLTNGTHSAPIPGSNATVRVTLNEHVAHGQWQGIPAAAVVLAANTGGSGTFYDLALVLAVNDRAVQVAATELGDRIVVNAVRFEDDGRLIVDMVQQGPNDALCCPTQHVVNAYAMQLERLVSEPAP
jgi:hypothetical protein